MVAHPTAEGHEWPIAVIPVIDLLSGQVVHARAGQRDLYAPIHTPLVQGSDPEQVLAALLNRSKAKTAYIADLDGIMHGHSQWPLIHQLAACFSDITIWLDAGFTHFERAQSVIQIQDQKESISSKSELDLQGSDLKKSKRFPTLLPVLGTESLLQLENLSRQAQHCVLSLDFGPEGFRGDPEWLSHPEYWPDRVIVMSLAKVGVGAGPDFEHIQSALHEASRLARPPQIFAAGGITQQHAVQLARLGVSGALVASALHARSS
jgi:phosphoribosylformimino-5-aminoimidazole carboxamide ribotide isomerase